MSDYLKKNLQKLLAGKRHRLYEERLSEQAVPYRVWLEGVIEEERAEILAWEQAAAGGARERLSVSVLSEETFRRCVFDREMQEKQGDVWLVASDERQLADTAVLEAERYFLEHESCMIAYGDEDRYLKPGWSPDLLQSFFYFGNVFAVRKGLIGDIAERIRKRVGDTAPERAQKAGGSADKERARFLLRERIYDIVLCCIDEAKEAGHIEKILFLADGKGEEAQPCGEERRPSEKYGDWGRESAFDEIKEGHLYSDVKIPEKKEEQPLVSAIILSKDNPAMLSKCIHSLRERTAYRNVEIIVIDNGSSEKNKDSVLQMQAQLREEYSFRYFYRPMEFNFSALCNLGVKEAEGEYLLFLNDDV